MILKILLHCYNKMSDFEQLPYPGQLVDVEYLEVDEIEVVCTIPDYSCHGYLNNTKMRIKPDHLGDRAVLKVVQVDEYGHVTLSFPNYSLD